MYIYIYIYICIHANNDSSYQQVRLCILAIFLHSFSQYYRSAVAVCCRVLQCAAACCSVLWGEHHTCIISVSLLAVVLQCCCSAVAVLLQCCCSVCNTHCCAFFQSFLFLTYIHTWSTYTSRNTATRCNTVQHTATHMSGYTYTTHA